MWVNNGSWDTVSMLLGDGDRSVGYVPAGGRGRHGRALFAFGSPVRPIAWLFDWLIGSGGSGGRFGVGGTVAAADRSVGFKAPSKHHGFDLPLSLKNRWSERRRPAAVGRGRCVLGRGSLRLRLGQSITYHREGLPLT